MHSLVHCIAGNRSLNNRFYCWLPIEIKKGVTGCRACGGFWKLHISTLLLSQSPSLHLTANFSLLAPFSKHLGFLSLLLALPGISCLARPTLSARALDKANNGLMVRLGHCCPLASQGPTCTLRKLFRVVPSGEAWHAIFLLNN